ncbi:hypothetical protein [Diaphorobacter sp. LR2014-1]|uniref:hypothetical protein n=1 Tax=Diaphorobacter sp. LR2014-1 TaxID=1933219 RepID=UPI000CDA4B66|nr:hypothetical protein [Diaphorobacter sp. LR2014-1]POR07988.1 hypothetical protein BV908_18575 [Diaphorobacter sp. LR2014-1]
MSKFIEQTTASRDQVSAVLLQELPGVPPPSLKARVLETVYEMDCLQVLEGYQLLAAKHMKNNVGIYVVNGNFGRDHYRAAISEAKKAGLNTHRLYVYAETATYSGRAICVTQFADIWPQ